MKIKSVLILLITSFIFLAGCSTNNVNVRKNIPTRYMQASFIIDVNDLRQVVGSADYVFVAYVNEDIETIYKNPVPLETKDGVKEISDPYTKYAITVIDNIKGNLKKNNKMEIQKVGGLQKDGSFYSVYENDELLTVGSYHIIAAYAQPDGSLLISGPNSSVKLNCDNKNDIMSSKEYIKYKNAFKNEVKRDRERFRSKHEA